MPENHFGMTAYSVMRQGLTPFFSSSASLDNPTWTSPWRTLVEPGERAYGAISGWEGEQGKDAERLPKNTHSVLDQGAAGSRLLRHGRAGLPVDHRFVRARACAGLGELDEDGAGETMIASTADPRRT